MSEGAVVGLVVAAFLFGPLLLLGCYVIADRLEWPIAGRILDMFAATLATQFVIGALVNIALGIALTGLAVWAVQHFHSTWRFPGAGAIVLLGMWRVWRGIAILWGGYQEWR